MQENGTVNNMVISPVSVRFALSMLLNGAEGHTKRALENALGGTTDELNTQNKTILESPMFNPALPQPEMDISHQFRTNPMFSNSIWVSKGRRINGKFIESLNHFYSASLFSITPNKDGVNKINNWVFERTKIAKCIDDLPANFELALINTIMFNGVWQGEFQQEKMEFTSSGKISEVEGLVSDERTFKLELGRGFVKDYQDGSKFIAVLPDLPDNFQSLDLKEIIAAASSTRLNWSEVHIPKFAFDSSHDLEPILASMGLGEIFTFEANFERITKKPICVSSVIQKAKIKFNETGTEASAATAITMVAWGVSKECKEYLLFDRPFFYLIVKEGQILFMGVVCDP